MDFKHFMSHEAKVIDCLSKDHHLEEDTVMDLLREHGDQLRESTLIGLPAEAIANELASYVSK